MIMDQHSAGPQSAEKFREQSAPGEQVSSASVAQQMKHKS